YRWCPELSSSCFVESSKCPESGYEFNLFDFKNRMILKQPKIPIQIRVIAAITCVAFVVGCATAPQTARGPEYAPTAGIMRPAHSPSVAVDKRAADYLHAAPVTAPLRGSGIGTPACETYNAACGDLT